VPDVVDGDAVGEGVLARAVADHQVAGVKQSPGLGDVGHGHGMGRGNGADGFPDFRLSAGGPVECGSAQELVVPKRP
jgi:hypothetical protein